MSTSPNKSVNYSCLKLWQRDAENFADDGRPCKFVCNIVMSMQQWWQSSVNSIITLQCLLLTCKSKPYQRQWLQRSSLSGSWFVICWQKCFIVVTANTTDTWTLHSQTSSATVNTVHATTILSVLMITTVSLVKYRFTHSPSRLAWSGVSNQLALSPPVYYYVSACWAHRWAVQKWLNQWRYLMRGRFMGVQGTM